jgi:hypothetical protein
MTEEEKLAVLRRVGEVLAAELHGNFMDFYATAVALTETQPDQVNNEVRNAVTHLGRALIAGSEKEAHDQIRLGRAHIERATRDAIKLSVLELTDRIHDACEEIKLRTGTIGAPFIARRDQVTAKRKKVLRAEIDGDPDVIQLFVELFNDADQLEADLTSEFNLKKHLTPPWRRAIVRFRRSIWGAFAAVMIGLIAGIILMIIFPDGFGPSNAVRHFLHLPPVAPPPAASSPSAPAKPGVPAWRP